ncbi:MAG: hypothetical protein JW893_00305 [Candidatus Omnitrophica bacterium]|nr:hypothetical protein [Candidatus Omnitrophota bacterium]
MREYKFEKPVLKAYRSWIESEIRRPEVRREKDAFVKTYFSKPPLFFLRPAFLAPASSFAVMMFIAVLWYWPTTSLKPGREIQMMHREGAVVENVASGDSDVVVSPGMVDVKRVASRVGTPMVYYKSNHGQPITIIWIFTGGNTP